MDPAVLVPVQPHGYVERDCVSVCVVVAFFFFLFLSHNSFPFPFPFPSIFLFSSTSSTRTVYSAGNYRTVDFVKIGTPLTFWLLVGTAVILGFPDQWYIPLAASSAAMVLSVAGPVAVERFQQRKSEKKSKELEA